MPEPPPERTETARERLRAALDSVPQTARELSPAVGLSEKQVLGHLEHLRRSLEAEGTPLRIEPATCRQCGFAFETRDRLGAPSRCPKCKSERIRPPAFSI